MASAIFYLTQNNDIRRTYLKTSLYFLFKNFNHQHNYQVIIFHEGDYDEKSQNEVLQGIRGNSRNFVRFQKVDKDDFVLPDNIDKNKLDNCINTHVTPYWRNDKYRLMCRWWLNNSIKYAKRFGYEYIMRFDDDSIIEEQIPDIFQWFKDKDAIYSSNLLHVDCELCCFGMKEFFEKNTNNTKNNIIEKLFHESKVDLNNPAFNNFKNWLKIAHPDYKIENVTTLYKPFMFYNNFFITKVSFWNSDDVKKILKSIDEDESIFYCRWGDAPLQSIIAQLYGGPDKVVRCQFKYSKRMQREAFKGDDGNFYQYMPQSYDKSSCITEYN